MDYRTKEFLAKTLIVMLQTSSVDKISVKQLTNKCGLSRQTFYNHFQDIYELVEWIYQNAIEKLIFNNKNCKTWQQGFIRLLNFTRDNKTFVQNTYKDSTHDILKKYMYKIINSLVLAEVERQSVGISVEQRYKNFFAHFYSVAFLNIDLEWVKTGMIEEPTDMVEQIDVLIKGDLKKALTQYAN